VKEGIFMDEKILHGKKNGMLVLLISLLIYAVATIGLILTIATDGSTLLIVVCIILLQASRSAGSHTFR
jgi:hypothetical protein